MLEQTIGRGLRLMWRDAEYNDLKRENRERINGGQEPGSLLDVLSIVEHPAFQSFYDDLIKEGLAGTTGDGMDDTSATGDVIAAELRESYEAFDFGIPFILQEADEVRDHHALDLTALPGFTTMSLDQLTALLGKGDTFISQDLQSATLFGDYRVDGAVMNVSGYNEYLSRLTRRILRHYVRETGLDAETIKEKLIGKGDFFFSPEEAIKLNLADSIKGL